MTNMAASVRSKVVFDLVTHNTVRLRAYNSEMNSIIEGLGLLSTPEHLKEFEEVLVEALLMQIEFVNKWASFGEAARKQFAKYYYRKAGVKNTHKKLEEAHKMLRSLYPFENAKNQKAFYSQICALRFN